MKIVRWIVFFLVIAALIPAAAQATPALTVLTSTLRLTSANNGQTFNNYRISTGSGDCVDINGATGVTFENSNIGPCAGRGVYLNGGSGNKIYDSYIHVQGASTSCCDRRDGVFVNASGSATIQGNVIAYSESNIEAVSSKNLVVTGNFLLNPQGPFPRGEQLQIAEGAVASVTNNLLVSTPDSTLGPAIGTGNSAGILYGQDDSGNRPSDSLSIYETQSATVKNNYITGGLDAVRPYSGGCQGPMDCGLIVDGSNSVSSNSEAFDNNILVNTGGCGINIATGTNQIVTGNQVINLNPNSGGAETAFVIWNEYAPACGPILFDDNVGTTIPPSGYASGYWNGGGCTSGSGVTCNGTNRGVTGCNTFDEGGGRTAYDTLISDPVVTKPPLIPPKPMNCVVTSPYSTQTSLPPCG